MQRVVFLDIDGVIATESSYNRWRGLVSHDERPEAILDEKCCGRVQRLCDLTEAVVVVSSSWRILHTLDELRQMFATRGLSTQVVGKTPNLHHRGKEIDAIVRELELAPERFVILEDEEDVSPWNRRRIQTAFRGTRSGFQEKHLRRALRLFGIESG